MCTVSIVHSEDGLRLVCNRDERRARPQSLDPVARRIGERTALFPVDPLSGGTWIGINDAGVALALLNRKIGSTVVDGWRQSRGVIIPSLLGYRALDEVVAGVRAFDAANFQPFRLIAVHAARIAVITSDGTDLSFEGDVVEGPMVFTSSSLGDHVVAAPRRELFERMVLGCAPGRWLDAQARFHRHRWPSCPAISVRMTRSDARTMSRTVIDVSARGISLHYRPLRQVH